MQIALSSPTTLWVLPSALLIILFARIRFVPLSLVGGSIGAAPISPVVLAPQQAPLSRLSSRPSSALPQRTRPILVPPWSTHTNHSTFTSQSVPMPASDWLTPQISAVICWRGNCQLPKARNEGGREGETEGGRDGGKGGRGGEGEGRW